MHKPSPLGARGREGEKVKDSHLHPIPKEAGFRGGMMPVPYPSLAPFGIRGVGKKSGRVRQRVEGV